MSFFSKQIDKRISAYQQELIATHYAEVDWAAICEYLEKLDTDLSNVDTVVKTGNKMADAIINSKISLARSKNIPVKAKPSPRLTSRCTRARSLPLWV